MRAWPLILLILSSLPLLGQKEHSRTFRQWMGGQEVGGAIRTMTRDNSTEEVQDRQWVVLSRLGQEIRQDVTQTSRKRPGGGLVFTWRLQLSAEPFEGRAEWSPLSPALLSLQPAHGPAVQKVVPTGAVLWPGELEARLKEAARLVRPVRATTFAFPLQQWNILQLEPQGAAPLPGFPDAIRFTGQESEGQITTAVEIWISPSAGEVRHRTELGGLELLTQRAELPAPTKVSPSNSGLFARSQQALAPHPFQPWVTEWTLRAGGGLPTIPEDPQQSRLSGERLRLRRAEFPTPQEASQPPVKGVPPPEEARFLAPSALVPFQDPAFDGLLRRMDLPAGLSRWGLAQRVTSFVFEWITEKDVSVDFASALEVCRRPRGDCTEHGVLAVALLRRLGVPARGVTGWVGLGELMGIHFWVEVRLKDRWIPVDPTFDQAPASALRVKLGDTDLADLGSIAWDGAASDLSSVRWTAEATGAVVLSGELVHGPGGKGLRFPGGRWALRQGILHLQAQRGGPWQVWAVNRPGEAQLRGAQRLAGARTLRTGWWHSTHRRLWMDLGESCWLQVEGVSEAEAYELLDQLTAPTSSS
ncbi:MAG: transglutaminase domain-containing protein [Geothrix sp.]|uniref:transglutaminase-like domain-containing protein n=1 Tax=Geothrix sp. TaxID=1962974 RepID=UPI003BAF7577